MAQAKQIESIIMDKLIAHPANANRMSQTTFKKLIGHIAQSGNYEPVIVRRHPKQADCFEIINGHHRVKALKQLGHAECDCITWDVDDDQTLILLATLNRLAGVDKLDKKTELIKSLSKHFDAAELAKILPDTKKTIERLKDLSKIGNTQKLREKMFLSPQVFFLNDDENQIVAQALTQAMADITAGTIAQKRAKAIVKIAQSFTHKLQNNLNTKD